MRTLSESAQREVNARSAAGARAALSWWVLALLSSAQFILIIDVTVVNLALPSIAEDLALSRT